MKEKRFETVLEVNLDALIYNLKVYQSYLSPGTKTLVMVKAHSYGSGDYEVVKELETNGVDYFAVANTYEGVRLREAGITIPMMVMNTEDTTHEIIISNNIEPVIYNCRSLRLFAESVRNTEIPGRKPYPVHLEIDTGMHRLGIERDKFDELFSILQQNTDVVKVKSIFSHLAGSDVEALDYYSERQFELFEKYLPILREGIGYDFMRHMLNSAGISRFGKYEYDLVRLGVGLYGVDPTGLIQDKLRTVTQLKSFILQVKKIPKGESVGYNRNYYVERDSIIATIGIGYADGVYRRIGNGIASFKINGHFARVIGNISMDLTIIDITGLPGVKEGDEVIIYGEGLPPKQLADWGGTIPNEFISTVSQRVKRKYIRD